MPLAAGPSRGAWLLAWAVLTAGITLARWEVVALPPYEDQSFCWLEASFLAHTDFDYHRLRYEENWAAGEPSGARGYMISVIPTLLAVGMRCLPSIGALIVVAHLLTFACGAAIALLAAALARPVAGNLLAALVAASILCTPQFGVQVDMVGMDIPMTTAALIAARWALAGRGLLAVAAGLVAFFLKPTGAVVCAALVVYFGVMAWRRRGDAVKSNVGALRDAALALVALAIAALVIRWGGSIPVTVGLTEDFRVLQLPLAWQTTPELVVVFAAACLGSLVAAPRLLQAMRGKPSEDSAEHEFRLLLWSWIIVLGLLVATTRVLYLPRYLTLVVPFLLLIAGVLVARTRPRWLGPAALVVLIAFDITNQHGQFLPDLNRVYADLFARNVVLHARSNAFTERSREYLVDQRSILRAVAILRERHADTPILAGQSMTRYLTEPNLGYVERPLRAVRAHPFRPALAAFVAAETAGHEGMPPQTPIFIWHGEARAMIPPPRPGDEILYEDDLTPPLVVYRQTLPASVNSPAALEEWYLEHSWDCRWARLRLYERTPVLIETGRRARFVVEALETLEEAPGEHDLRALMAENLLLLGRADEARQQLDQLDRAAPGHAGAARVRQIPRTSIAPTVDQGQP